MSTMAGDVTAHQADKNVPNRTETRTKDQYDSQKGRAKGAIPPTPRAIVVTTRAFTPGRSVKNPEMIRPRVLQIPTIERRKEASIGLTPLFIAKEGMNM